MWLAVSCNSLIHPGLLLSNGIVEALVTPEHLEGAAAGAIVMRDHYFRAIRILERHAGELPSVLEAIWYAPGTTNLLNWPNW